MSKKKSNKKPRISNKHEVFCLAYIETGDRVEAYYRAYGYNISKESATTSAYRLMQRKDVNDYIDYINQMRVEEVVGGKLEKRAMEELVKVALSPDHMYPTHKMTAILKLIDLMGIDSRDDVDEVIASQVISDEEDIELNKKRLNKLRESQK